MGKLKGTHVLCPIISDLCVVVLVRYLDRGYYGKLIACRSEPGRKIWNKLEAKKKVHWLQALVLLKNKIETSRNLLFYSATCKINRKNLGWVSCFLITCLSLDNENFNQD